MMSFEVVRNGTTGMCVTAQGDYFCGPYVNGQLLYVPEDGDEQTLWDRDSAAYRDVSLVAEHDECLLQRIYDFMCSFHFPACKKEGDPEPAGMCYRVCYDYAYYCVYDREETEILCDRGGHFVDHENESARECSDAPSRKGPSLFTLAVTLAVVAIPTIARTFAPV